MSRKPRPESVLIDGIRYAPVSEANPSVPALEDVIISQWAGDNWRTSYPDAASYLRVVVDDSPGVGETVTDFLARLARAISGSSAEGPDAAR